MKRRFIYFLMLILLITAVAVNQSGKGVMASDNVSYIMPFLHTHTNNVVYCIASNQSTDNASINVTVMANAAGYNATWIASTVSGYTLTARNSVMITFSGTAVTAGTSGSGSVSAAGSTGADAYGAIINFAGANSYTTTSGQWYTTPTFRADVNTLLTPEGGFSSLPNYTYGKNARLVGTQYQDTNNGYTTIPLTCQTLVMACFQGTTTPKRNLVGYMCMDTVNSMYPPTSF